MRPGVVLRLGLAWISLGLLLAGCGEGRRGTAGWAQFVSPAGTRVDLDAAAWNERGALFSRDAVTGAARSQYVLDHVAARGLRIPEMADDERLCLRLAGCREIEIPVPPPSDPLTVSYGYPVLLRIENDGVQPPASHELHLQLTWRGAGDEPDALLWDVVAPAAPRGWLEPRPGEIYESDTAIRGGESEVSFCVSAPAAYRVTWTLYRVGDGVRIGYGSPDMGTRIVVEDRPDEQVFVLPLDASALATAVQALAR